MFSFLQGVVPSPEILFYGEVGLCFVTKSLWFVGLPLAPLGRWLQWVCGDLLAAGLLFYESVIVQRDQ